MFKIIAVLIVILLLAGISFYISYRLHQGISSFFPKVKLWHILIGVSTIVLLLILSFVRGMTPFPVGLKSVLGIIGAVCMGIMLYLLLFTIAADLLTLIPRILKLGFTKHHLFNGFVTISVLSLTAITCIGGFINARQIDHVSYDIKLEGKRDISDINVVMISDLHLGAVGSEGRLEDIVSELNALNPDVICIAGDFFDTDFSSISDPDAAIKTLQKLNSTYGVYACLGNHDGGKTNSQMVEFLKKANVTLLREEYVVIDERLILIGRLDASSIGGYGDQKRQELSSFFTRTDPTVPVIVLDHNPAYIDEYTTEADLILCGHTHKGQVFPGSIITELMYDVDYGYYQKDASSPQVVVSSGIGAWGMPMRVGTDNEIVSISFSCN